MDFSCIYLSKYKKGKHKREYKIVNRKRWRFIIIDMHHLLLWKEVRGKEKKREKGNRERVRVSQSAATELLQTQPLGYLILHSSFFTLHLFSSLFVLHSSLFVLLFLLLLLLSQILRELKSCHIEELVERRYRFHQTRNEVGSRSLAIG